MKKPAIIDLVKVDEFSRTPKYLQIAYCIIREIENGNIHANESLPSINDLSIELIIARDTVERAYKHLKDLGVIDAVPKKGYFVKDANFRQSIKIFLLFNKLSVPAKIIYDSFVARLGEKVAIDFYVYNNDFLLFKKLMDNKKGDYTHYVILPHFVSDEKKNNNSFLNAALSTLRYIFLSLIKT